MTPICFGMGNVEVFFGETVQFFYNCMTWMDVALLAYQEEYCLIPFCPKKYELWTPSSAEESIYA